MSSRNEGVNQNQVKEVSKQQMTLKEQLIQELNQLSHADLEKVGDFLHTKAQSRVSVSLGSSQYRGQE